MNVEDLLLLERFDIRATGSLSVGALADIVSATSIELSQCLAELEASRLVERIHPRGTTDYYFVPTLAGWQAREELLRARGLRHPALVDATKDDTLGLVLALLMAGHVENSRMKSGVVGRDARLTLDELQFYLQPIDVARLTKVIAHGVQQAMVRAEHRLPRLYGSGKHDSVEAFAITKMGQAKYADVSRQLNLSSDESVLDLQVADELVVFNSWQSEYEPSRAIIGTALTNIVKELNRDPRVFRPITVLEATKPGDGAVRIDQILLNRIKASHLFIGDVTPVYRHDQRLCLNDNVLVEVGYALASKAPEQIILLCKKRPDLEDGVARLAFDLRHVHRHPFENEVDLVFALKAEIEAALRGRGWLR